MADRTLIWSAKRCEGNPTTLLPAYYMEGDYEKVAVRIHAEDAPVDEDAQFEIYADGESIMNDHLYNYDDYIANTATYTGETMIHLPVDDTEDTMAEDFSNDNIEAGTWVTCAFLKDGGGKNFTIILELNRLSDSDEETD